jgi:hypothetical protein
MIPTLFKKSWRGMSGVLDKPPAIPPQHDIFTLAPGSLGSLSGQEYSLTVSQLTPALSLVYSALGHLHGVGDIIGLGSAAMADAGDFAAAAHAHVLADVTDAGTAAAANIGDFAPAGHTHTLADVTDAGTAAAANVGDFAPAAHAHAAADITSGTIDTARLGSGVAGATTYLRGDQTWAAVAAGIGGSTGATDNLALRADGAGGSTLQNSALRIDDVTASTQQNLALVNVDAAANSAIVLTPKGTGAFILGPKPDGTTTGGAARGANAVDLQTASMTSSSQVASGVASLTAGQRNTASATYGMALGFNNIARGQSGGAYCFGGGNITGASSVGSVLVGLGNSSGNYYFPMAFGGYNAVNAQNAVALGFRGTISHSGCVVVGANDDQAVSSDRVKQFKVRADGGMTHQTDGGTMTHWGKRAAAPVTGIAAGDIYYNTATNKHYGYDGAAWNAFW